MSQSSFFLPRLAWFALTLSLFAPVYAQSQVADPATIELQKRAVQLLNDGKTDEVLRLSKEYAAERPGSADIAQALFSVSRLLFVREKFDASLDLLQVITEKFPAAPAASLAWCGIGQVYEKKGDEPKMIAALERGMAAPRAATQVNIMDAGDTHSYACERLGAHYIKTKQWDKALAIYTDWKPSSWCGNCLDAMKSSKVDHQLLCLIHLGRLQEATDLAWHAVAEGPTLDRIPEFVLLRLYNETGQRSDFLLLLYELRLRAKNLAAENRDVTEIAAVENVVKKLDFTLRRVNAAVGLLQESDWNKLIEELLQYRDEDGYSPSIESHVVSWLIVRDPTKTVPIIVRAALEDDDKQVKLGAILTAIDSPAARKGLVTIAISGSGIGHQQEICGLIAARVHDPDSLINQIKSLVRGERKKYLYSSQPPASFSKEFHLSWPTTKKGTLPKTLPRDVFVKDGGN